MIDSKHEVTYSIAYYMGNIINKEAHDMDKYYNRSLFFGNEFFNNKYKKDRGIFDKIKVLLYDSLPNDEVHIHDYFYF